MRSVSIRSSDEDRYTYATSTATAMTPTDARKSFARTPSRNVMRGGDYSILSRARRRFGRATS